MKVFVLGGTGFIGSRVVKTLVQRGHRVTALARGAEKAAFLERLGAMEQQHRLPLITIMITGAYGPGSWFKESVYDLMQKGWFRIFGDGKNVWSLVHVDDVAEAYRLAVEKLPIGQSFVVADDEPCTMVDLANFVAREMGKPPVKFFPRWLGRIMLGSVLLEGLTMNQRARNTKAKRELGWKPRYPTYKEGIPAVIRELETRQTSLEPKYGAAWFEH